MTLHQIINECPAMTTQVPLLLRTIETDDSFSHSPSSQRTQRFQSPCGKHPPASASFTHLRETPGTHPTDTPLVQFTTVNPVPTSVPFPPWPGPRGAHTIPRIWPFLSTCTASTGSKSPPCPFWIILITSPLAS